MEQQIKIAAKLYQCRETAKNLFRKEFNEKIEPYKKIIAGVAKDKNINELKALTLICEDERISSHGITLIVLMAAAVELIEQSKQTNLQ